MRVEDHLLPSASCYLRVIRAYAHSQAHIHDQTQLSIKLPINKNISLQMNSPPHQPPTSSLTPDSLSLSSSSSSPSSSISSTLSASDDRRTLLSSPSTSTNMAPTVESSLGHIGFIRALSVLREMRQAGFRPPIQAWQYVVDACVELDSQLTPDELNDVFSLITTKTEAPTLTANSTTSIPLPTTVHKSTEESLQGLLTTSPRQDTTNVLTLLFECLREMQVIDGHIPDGVVWGTVVKKMRREAARKEGESGRKGGDGSGYLNDNVSSSPVLGVKTIDYSNNVLLDQNPVNESLLKNQNQLRAANPQDNSIIDIYPDDDYHNGNNLAKKLTNESETQLVKNFLLLCSEEDQNQFIQQRLGEIMNDYLQITNTTIWRLQLPLSPINTEKSPSLFYNSVIQHINNSSHSLVEDESHAKSHHKLDTDNTNFKVPTSTTQSSLWTQSWSLSPYTDNSRVSVVYDNNNFTPTTNTLNKIP